MDQTTTRVHPALAPTRLGRIDLSNRFAVAPMTRVSATPDGVPTAEMADYYARFAEGGFGLVITEGTYPDSSYSQGYLNQPGLSTAAQVEGWREVTGRVHAAGRPIIAQLMHAGAISQGNPHRSELVGPSAVQPVGEMMPEYGGRGPWPTPRELSAGEIDDIIAGFAAAAVRAQEAGFDGVEIHAANGYLLDQFLTVYTNERTDTYGGPVANRIRLTAEVAEAIVAATPAELVVGVRLSQTKVNDFEYRWPGGAYDAEVIFSGLAATGIDYLHIASEGRDWLETARLQGGHTLTGLARRISGLPVIANGGMHDPAQADLVLTDGHADLLAVARGALANPDLPRRLAENLELTRFDRTMLEPTVTLANVRQWQTGRL
ncbi:2,4-dienoyl-CoA reductase-like NADH-dependent reductase (Old Yellow Enzyme family) [Kribbella steppae]|uniref:2,4-dienoyl-CoA reductase-like NADH-dependent reductase (Old Yellow Enzyme family) n=1 Tax=Kribbella steppae TaxID=2512223 RepID=A0A4R2GZS4_9ACTN|nr:NADH:flavin oxidoreductase [Kribbella steppae]TCO17307.1 2,4-dienoyl-CoA reductase-like NADH-dependent reductase (Old Yellow Enzyme family) [Kribbella steppae]